MWSIVSYCMFSLLLYCFACRLIHVYFLRTGQVVARRHQLRRSDGSRDTISYKCFAGDWGTALVAQELFEDDVYMRHGIHLPVDGRPPLVVDIGGNIGLFSVAMLRRCPDATIVVAEPLPDVAQLCSENIAATVATVAPTAWTDVEEVAIGTVVGAAAPEVWVDVTVDPRITAGASICESAIVRPMREASWCEQLYVIGVDNVRAGNLPPFPTLLLCRLLRGSGGAVLRWIIAAALAPALFLFTLLLCCSPVQRRRVSCRCIAFADLLHRAAARATVRERKRRLVSGPIDLVKIDVEGAELTVLQGIDDADWRRIFQLVVEVHDLDGRLQYIIALLREKGFVSIEVEKEAWASHELLCIRTVFASKAGREGAGGGAPEPR